MKTVAYPSEDSIFSLNEEFKKDPREQKINGGIGVYVENGKPFVLPVVQKVAKTYPLHNFNYLPISGDSDFLQKTSALLLGESLYKTLQSELIVQGAAGGTNGLFTWGSYMKYVHSKPVILIGNPTWENHKKIFSYLGFTIQEYSHIQDDHTFHLESMVDCMKNHPGSTLLLHGGGAHNPTGINVSMFHWETIAKAIEEYNISVVVDFAYLGLGTSIANDISWVHMLFQKNLPSISCILSFSKNFSLYQHRTAVLVVKEKNTTEKKRLMQYLFRISNSNPPAYGEYIVDKILGDDQLRQQWEASLTGMIQSLQKRRVSFIRGAGTSYSWVESTSGLFCLLGLTNDQIVWLKREYGIYLLPNSRINFGGMTQEQAFFIGKAISQL